jgi:hypothetical protein
MLRKRWADFADFEPLHLALSSPHYLMRILRPIVASKLLLMGAGSAGDAGMPSRRSAACPFRASSARILVSAACSSAAAQCACRVGAEPAYRVSRPRGQRRATDRSTCRRSEPPSRRGAIDRSAAAGAAASLRAIKGPNFRAQRRTVSWEMSSPRLQGDFRIHLVTLPPIDDASDLGPDRRHRAPAAGL